MFHRLTASARPRILLSLLTVLCLQSLAAPDPLAIAFSDPPPHARPWVYWMWMDGNLTREGITADLEAMHRAGIGGVIIMEVNVGIPRGPVHFMSPEWRALFKHVASEAARLGIEIDLNAGPGWTGSGGPWIKPEQSMQKLVFSQTNLTGPIRFAGALPQPPGRENFYRDVAVLAYPAQSDTKPIPDLREKALYHRGHYSSEPGVPSSLPEPPAAAQGVTTPAVPRKEVLDLSANLDTAGKLTWDVPAGRWTILRFGRTSTGANTRPAPEPGLGLECDKLDKAALDAHFDRFIGTLMNDIGPLTGKSLVSLHIDSWEMGPQNWTAQFRREFQRLRKYDPLTFLPVMAGQYIDSPEISERFLWDLRQTVQDLIVENHARHLRALAHRHNMRLAIEPYDGTPCDDLTLGAVADVPMCEFWLYGFNTSFTCLEATSIAHTYGQRVIAAEAFTSSNDEAWRAHPASMKVLGDWAFCAGVNRFVFHRYQHQPWLDRFPGMTMGPYGVHHERTQTWWEMAHAYHKYLARCQYMLQQGLHVADICYLSPEGAPNVFHPPATSTRGTPPDRLGYNFDAITPEALLTRMSVKNGLLTLPDGMAYRVLVLPHRQTMTPPLLKKIQQLAAAGAVIIGSPPEKSPSLSNYPDCDTEVKQLAEKLWANSGGQNNRILQAPQSASQLGKKPAENPLKTAKWIWYPEGNPASSAPVANRYFRRTISLPADIESASISITADNSFALVVNGTDVGWGDNFHIINTYDLKARLKPGENLIFIGAANGANTPNPAGLIAYFSVTCKDGRRLEFSTDKQWESATSPEARWTAALELGPLGIAPWGNLKPTRVQPEDYPDYLFVAGILRDRGVMPDFESNIRLRYTHRRDGNKEIYFVANPEDKTVQANCTFRVAGKTPALWDPLTGEIRALPEFTSTDGCTTILLTFEPAQSFFIVFGDASRSPAPAKPNFPALQTRLELQGPWELSFNPKWGGPVKTTFPVLQDWTKHPEPGIRYYSGTATYRKQFDAPENLSRASTQARRVFLDLGTVQNLAQVRLNGTDLGVVWCAPWRVDVTAQLQARGNRLEIDVVNLWPNRLIGDEQFPPDCEYVGDGNLGRWPEWLLKNQPRPSKDRYTFTTWKHFSKKSPLLPSGLLGPVTLNSE